MPCGEGGNFRDPAEVVGALGALAMSASFGVLIFGDGDPSLWLWLPLFAIAALGFAGEHIWNYRRRRAERRATSPR